MKGAVSIALILLSPALLQAQSNCTANPASCSTAANTLLINLTVGRALQLSIAPTSTALSTPTPANYDAGFAATTGPTATLRSNAPWTLAISAGAATWTAVDTQSEPARTNKPASDLLWATAAGGPFVALTTTPATFASGVATAGATAPTLFYQTLYAWNLDTPGNYSLQIVFTITAP